MNKTFIHIIFIPIIASLLFAWGHFGKVSEPPGELDEAIQPASMVAEYSESAPQISEPIVSYESQIQRAHEQGSNQYKITELQTKIAEIKIEINELNAAHEDDLTQEEQRRAEAIEKFESSLRIINHTDISEFETSEARPELAHALADFLIESEQARGLGIEVEACTSFGCQLSIDKATQPIAELMRLNRVMMEQGESRFGASSLHLVGSGPNQRIMLVWQE